MHLISYTKTLVISFLFISCFSQTAQGQDYKSSIGGRLGTYISISYTNNLSESKSFEIIAGISREANQSDYILGGYYKLHMHVTSQVPTLNWYAGLGVFANLKDEAGDKVIIAPTGIIGMEYALEHAPVNFFVDLSPNYNLNTDSDSKFNIHANLGVRYIINR